jgi:hypothetical protein
VYGDTFGRVPNASIREYIHGDTLLWRVQAEVEDVEVAVAIDGVILPETQTITYGLGAYILPTRVGSTDPFAKTWNKVTTSPGFHEVALYAKFAGVVHRVHISMADPTPTHSKD